MKLLERDLLKSNQAFGLKLYVRIHRGEVFFLVFLAPRIALALSSCHDLDNHHRSESRTQGCVERDRWGSVLSTDGLPLTVPGASSFLRCIRRSAERRTRPKLQWLLKNSASCSRQSAHNNERSAASARGPTSDCVARQKRRPQAVSNTKVWDAGLCASAQVTGL
ncbi:hypothetical protein IWX47DRAFT_594439 [Phyllosticta citricarpa]